MIQYINRKKKEYYLHQGVTKTGKAKYHFSQTKEGANVTSIPQGFEVYESPNAQVFLRKIQPQLITNEEIMSIEHGLRHYCNLEHWITDTKKKVVSIYLPDQNVGALTSIFQEHSEFNYSKMGNALAHYLTFSPMLQFVLTDKQQRLFQTRRYCFLGGIDDWIDIGNPGDINKLVEVYTPHLGEESYFELL